jgi:hypothetical protein
MKRKTKSPTAGAYPGASDLPSKAAANAVGSRLDGAQPQRDRPERRPLSRKKIPVFLVRVGGKYIVGFAYPPRVNGKYRALEPGEIRVSEGIYAMVGSENAHEWISETAESSAQHVAGLVGGKVERVER